MACGKGGDGGGVSDLQVCCARTLCLGGRKKDSCLHAVLGSGVCSKIVHRRAFGETKNLPIECAQGDQPLRCPNRSMVVVC